ncbi:MAG: hypothetical protein LBB75_04245 [Oscillospiraceae bacterium]|nr:hypothetical protein [Oscillospiraceae bacterium]
MFACLQITKARPRGWRRAAPPALVRVEPPGGAPFFRLEVTRRGRGELPWAEIERAAGRLRTRMMFPEGLCPPPPPPPRSAAQAQLEPGLRAFVPRRLPLLLCLRAAQQVLQAARAPARQLRVTVVDSRGVLARQLEPLVPLAGSLRVFTPDPGLYRAAAEQLQRRYGVALVVSDSPACFAQSHVVVADGLRLFTGRESGLILTPDAATALPGCRAARCGEPVLPEAYARLCPPGIDPLRFACALYELCGVKEMERLRFTHFSFDGVGQAFTLEDLAGMVDNICTSMAPHLR